MKLLLIGRGKMGRLIQATAQAAGDEVVAAFGREDLARLASMGWCVRPPHGNASALRQDRLSPRPAGSSYGSGRIRPRAVER